MLFLKVLFIVLSLIILLKTIEYLGIKSSEKNKEITYELINILVEAAEQTFKDLEKSGSLKKEYVLNKLVNLDIDISEEIDSYIESAVYNLNKESIDLKN